MIHLVDSDILAAENGSLRRERNGFCVLARNGQFFRCGTVKVPETRPPEPPCTPAGPPPEERPSTVDRPLVRSITRRPPVISVQGATSRDIDTLMARVDDGTSDFAAEMLVTCLRDINAMRLASGDSALEIRKPEQTL